MLEHPVKPLLLPYWSDNVKGMENQQGEIMIDFSKEYLEELYVKFGSIKEISKFLNVPYSTIHYHFKENKIGNYKNRGIEISKIDLLKLHNEHGSIGKVASALCKNYATVRAWYSYYDIIINPSNMNIYQEIRNTPMTQIQKSVVIGSLLGDGHLRIVPHSKNALLEISHCEKQLDYLTWKKNLLSPFSRPIKLKEFSNSKKNICGNIVNASNFYRFFTVAHKDITDIFNAYYKNGLKGVNKTIIDEVDLLALSIWFGDDGSIRRNKNKEPICCSIATNSFSYDEQLVLVEVLKKFFNGTIKVYKCGGVYNGIKREDYIIEMFVKNKIQQFLCMIKSILPKCIYYKLS